MWLNDYGIPLWKLCSTWFESSFSQKIIFHTFLTTKFPLWIIVFKRNKIKIILFEFCLSLIASHSKGRNCESQINFIILYPTFLYGIIQGDPFSFVSFEIVSLYFLYMKMSSASQNINNLWNCLHILQRHKECGQ